jgi:hypothetical protein
MKLKGDFNFVKKLATKYKLVPHLERALSEGDFPWEFGYEPKPGDDAFHPSGDCTPSLLDLYEKATGTAAPSERQLPYKTFMVGHFWHAYLQWVLVHKLEFAKEENIERRGTHWWGAPVPWTADRAAWVPIASKMDVAKPFNWATGSADVACCEIPEHGNYLVDFKTQKSLDFRKQEIPEAYGYAQKWECQASIYLDWFGEMFDLQGAIFVCINKDSPHDMKEYEFAPNPELVESIYKKWELVGLCVDEGLAPPALEEGRDALDEWPLPLRGPING